MCNVKCLRVIVELIGLGENVHALRVSHNTDSSFVGKMRETFQVFFLFKFLIFLDDYFVAFLASEHFVAV